MTAQVKLSIHDFIRAQNAAGRGKLARFADDLFELRTRGYSREQIREYLASHGVSVNVDYLSRWFHKTKRPTPLDRAIQATDFPAAKMFKEAEEGLARPWEKLPAPAGDSPDAERFNNRMDMADRGFAKILELVPALANEQRLREESIRRFVQQQAPLEKLNESSYTIQQYKAGKTPKAPKANES